MSTSLLHTVLFAFLLQVTMVLPFLEGVQRHLGVTRDGRPRQGLTFGVWHSFCQANKLSLPRCFAVSGIFIGYIFLFTCFPMPSNAFHSLTRPSLIEPTSTLVVKGRLVYSRLSSRLHYSLHSMKIFIWSCDKKALYAL